MITVFGSIGMDLLFSLPHLPVVGETVLTPAYTTAVGGIDDMKTEQNLSLVFTKANGLRVPPLKLQVGTRPLSRRDASSQQSLPAGLTDAIP
jgi:hypothetical protein